MSKVNKFIGDTQITASNGLYVYDGNHQQQGKIVLGSGLYSYISGENSGDLVVHQEGSSSKKLYLGSAGGVVVALDTNNNDGTPGVSFSVVKDSLKSGTNIFSVREDGRTELTGSLIVTGSLESTGPFNVSWLNTETAIFDSQAIGPNGSVVIKRNGQSKINFGSYSGNYQPGLQMQSYSNSEALILLPGGFIDPYGGSLGINSLIRTYGSGLAVRTGGTGTGTDSMFLRSNGHALFFQGMDITGSLVTTDVEGPTFYATSLSSTDKFFFRSDAIGDDLCLSMTRGANSVDLIGVIDYSGTPVSHFAEKIYYRSGKIGINTDTNTTYDLMVNGTTRLAGDTNITGDSNGTLTIARSATSPTGSLIISGSDTSRYGDDDVIIYNYAPGIRFVDRSTGVTNFRLGVQNDYFTLSIDTDQDQDTIDTWADFDDYSTAVTVDNTGNVGINNSAGASYRLDVKEETSALETYKYVARFWNDGNDEDASGIVVQCGSDGTPTKATPHLLGLDGDGDLLGYVGHEASTGNYVLVNSSDERLKKNIRNTSVDGLKVVKSVNIYDFEWIKSDASVRCDFVAQDLEKHFPNAVGEIETPKGDFVKTVSKPSLIPVLFKAMQQQQELIDNLTARIQELESKIQ